MEQQQQSRYWNTHYLWTRRKFDPSFESWEERAFAEDQSAGGLGGCVWPPRSYSCSFCRREFRSAQALGGHMNVHRRDRAILKQSPGPLHTAGTGGLDSSSVFYGPNPNPSTNPDMIIASSSTTATIAATSLPIAVPPPPSNKISSSSSSSHNLGVFDKPNVVYRSNPSQILMKNFIAAGTRQVVISSSGSSGVELKLGRDRSYNYNYNWRKDEMVMCNKRQRDDDDDDESSTTENYQDFEANPVLSKKERITDSVIPLFMRKELVVPSHIDQEISKNSNCSAAAATAAVVVEELDLELRLGERPPKVMKKIM